MKLAHGLHVFLPQYTPQIRHEKNVRRISGEEYPMVHLTVHLKPPGRQNVKPGKPSSLGAASGDLAMKGVLGGILEQSGHR